MPNIISFVHMFKKIAPHHSLLDTASKFTQFSVSGLKDKKLIKKSKPTQKLKHTNYILESFIHFRAKWHQNRSLPFCAILFQSWCVFWGTVYFM